MGEQIRLNIGGTVYVTMRDTISVHEGTALGMILKHNKSAEIFIDMACFAGFCTGIELECSLATQRWAFRQKCGRQNWTIIVLMLQMASRSDIKYSKKQCRSLLKN